jgi:2-methylisocitrate lyase-like PEP mutase family enzyme
MVNQARNIINCVNMPLICDADTGYGNPINVMRMVKEYESVGVAGIHMEDQVTPKKCGHFEGKQVIPVEEMIKKIEAVIYARESEDFLLIARTDACSVKGIDDALLRARRYVEAGADMIFVESPQSVTELEKIARTFSHVPLLVNMVEGGKTPNLPFERLQTMGFKIVLYPTSSIRAVAKTLQELASHLHTYKNTRDYENRLVTFEGRNRITGLAKIKELENRFSVR